MNQVSITGKDGKEIPSITIGFENDSVKAAVIICHGFGEHAACYVELAERLLKDGFASIIPNQRGHGQPPENSKKWHGKIPGYQSFIDDILVLTDYIRDKLPGIPIVLYGHSMGGNIVINTLLKITRQQAQGYACAVLESPWLDLHNPISPLTITALRVLLKITPDLRILHRLRQADLSTVPERAEGYGKDPLYHGFLSVRLITGILDACSYAMLHAGRLPVNTYLAYADSDVVVCNKAINIFAKSAGDKVTLKEYESNHAIHNDRNRETFFDDIIEYMNSNLTP